MHLPDLIIAYKTKRKRSATREMRILIIVIFKAINKILSLKLAKCWREELLTSAQSSSVCKTEWHLSDPTCDQGRNLNDCYLRAATRWCLKSLLQQPRGAHKRRAQTAIKERKQKAQRADTSPQPTPRFSHFLCRTRCSLLCRWRNSGCWWQGQVWSSACSWWVSFAWTRPGTCSRTRSVPPSWPAPGPPQGCRTRQPHCSGSEHSSCPKRNQPGRQLCWEQHTDTDRHTDNRLLCTGPGCNSYTDGVQCSVSPELCSPPIPSNDCSELLPVLAGPPWLQGGVWPLPQAFGVPGKAARSRASLAAKALGKTVPGAASNSSIYRRPWQN